MSQHRHTVEIDLRLPESVLADLTSDTNWRVMVFCATDGRTVQDIAFPHQSEIKVNGGEIRANLRGLKNKPGTTKAVDITDSLRLKPANYNNKVEMTYALTTKVSADPKDNKAKVILRDFEANTVTLWAMTLYVRELIRCTEIHHGCQSREEESHSRSCQDPKGDRQENHARTDRV